jgi:hypothetical protein
MHSTSLHPSFSLLGELVFGTRDSSCELLLYQLRPKCADRDVHSFSFPYHTPIFYQKKNHPSGWFLLLLLTLLMSSVLLAPTSSETHGFPTASPAFLHGKTRVFPTPSRKWCKNKSTLSGVLLHACLFLSFLVSGVFFTPFAILVELNFTLNEFLVLA